MNIIDIFAQLSMVILGLLRSVRSDVHQNAQVVCPVVFCVSGKTVDACLLEF